MHVLAWLSCFSCAIVSHGFGGANNWHRATRVVPLFAEALQGGETVAELKEQLRAKGLKVTGLKAELKARLLEAQSPPTALCLDLDPAPAVNAAGARPAVVHLSKKQERQYMKDEPMSKLLFVGNLDLGVADLEAQLRAVFGAHGDLASVAMGCNKKTGEAAPFAMVEFEEDAGAAGAVAALHDAAAAPISGAGALRVELSHQTGSAARARERNKCVLTDEHVLELVAERELQRARGQFRAADRLRELLERKGVRVDDKARAWRTGDGRSGVIGEVGDTVPGKSRSNGVASLFEEELLNALGKVERGGTARTADRTGNIPEGRNGSRGAGREGARGGGRRDTTRNRDFGPSGHDYSRCAADSGPMALPAEEVDALLTKRLVAKLKAEFETADAIKEELQALGIEVNDNIKEWRADGGADREWLMRGMRGRDGGRGGGASSSYGRRD